MSYLQTKNLVCANAFLDALLDCVNTAPLTGLIGAGTCHLYTAGPVLSGTMVAADFTEASFSGYAAQSLSLTVGPVDPADSGRALQQTVNFIGDSSLAAPGEDCLGIWCEDSAADLFAAYEFENPVSFNSPGDVLNLDVILALKTILQTGL